MRYASQSGPQILVLGALGVSTLSGNVLAQEDSLEEVVVTAQRREERLSDVPISVSAYGQEQLDDRGVRSIDDIARLTPGVTFARTDQRNGAASNISIRGISSAAGAATTGIYIDDTPIQIRSLGYSAFNAFPQVFDLERVEVLRGPQGTLFGAGSQGGTLRFITPQPSLVTRSLYVRSEASQTQEGDLSYEGGAAFGAPLIENKLAFRVSAWHRRDGGWVDRTDWSRDTRTPTTVLDEDANRQDSTVARLALTYAPTDSLRITPSLYYQNLELHDTPSFWATLSDAGNDSFYNGNTVSAASEDRFYLPALKVEWDLGAVSLVSNTSYFNRNNEAVNDYSAFESGIWAANPFFAPGFFAQALQFNQQNNLTQELRLQSNDPAARTSWVLGTFYSHSRQTAKQFVQDTFLPSLIPMEIVFGPGATLADGLYTFVADPIIARDDQIAIYGQMDFKATDKLTLTAGLRASKTEVDASAQYRGPVVGPAVDDSGSQEEEPITPKIGASYKLNNDHMVYASAAKGFRIGGYNPRVGTPCNGQLASLGLTAAPSLYDSDTVWAYELGSKNALLDGRVRLSSSVFYIDWQDIQQSVVLNSCGFLFVTNLGSATSKGADVQADVQLLDNLLLNVSVGYTDAQYDETVQGGPSAATNLVTKGDHIVGSPWTGAVAAQYTFSAFGGRDAYARLDYQYQSGQTDRVPANNPANGTFDSRNLFQVPQTDLLSARVGTTWSGVDVSIFANNLLDSRTILSRASNPGPVPFFQLSTFRPRTFGLTATFRY
jgi:outer membrane receptor protein involved in Fe transport